MKGLKPRTGYADKDKMDSDDMLSDTKRRKVSLYLIPMYVCIFQDSKAVNSALRHLIAYARVFGRRCYDQAAWGCMDTGADSYYQSR